MLIDISLSSFLLLYSSASEHTHTHTVPFMMHSTTGHKFRPLSHDPGLSDVAPTLLDLMGLDIPKEMSGQSLLQK